MAFSSCEKSTITKDLAREVGYIDSGADSAVTLYSIAGIVIFIENGIFNGDVIDTEKLEKRNQEHSYIFPAE